ncbi:MAG: hypothetical protein E7618_03515 [Ruminococcaceae bacterium]|nr:hypothetical protein [Oscillospiraceae bacterium]
MTYTYCFDSETSRFETKLEMNQPITVLFQREHIVLQADPDGHAVFSHLDGRTLLTAKADGQAHRFDQVRCLVTTDKIVVNFPITKWIDHYPNCDGEFDRWSEVIVDQIGITCPIV